MESIKNAQWLTGFRLGDHFSRSGSPWTGELIVWALNQSTSDPLSIVFLWSWPAEAILRTMSGEKVFVIKDQLIINQSSLTVGGIIICRLNSHRS